MDYRIILSPRALHTLTIAMGLMTTLTLCTRPTNIKFRTVKRVPNASIVEFTSSAASLIHCSYVCAERKSKSFYFMESTKICLCNHAGDNGGESQSVNSIFYGLMPTIREACVTSADCTSTGSGCYASVCRCDTGYSYNPANDSCVSHCDEYGTTFQREIGAKLGGFDGRKIRQVSEKECASYCANATQFVCRTAEYVLDRNECHLSNETALTQPDAYFTRGGNNLLHRDCA